MKYGSGHEVELGDIVRVNMPSGIQEAKVVMLGENYQHLELEQEFIDWVKRDRVLDKEQIVIEWLGENPFAHNDPAYAPVGNQMFISLEPDIVLVKRGQQ
jgi:hypothetical protein